MQWRGLVRLLTWNVNGLRAVCCKEGGGSLSKLLADVACDIVCFQETKLSLAQLDASLALPVGYWAFYSCCRVKEGYSGVATFCRKDTVPVLHAEEGITGQLIPNGTSSGDTRWSAARGSVGGPYPDAPSGDGKDFVELDSEGRCVVTDHGQFLLFNLYIPNAASPERLEFKLHYLEQLQRRVHALLKAGRQVILCGDWNIPPEAKDVFSPKLYLRDSSALTGKVLSTWFEHPCMRWLQEFQYPGKLSPAAEGSTEQPPLMKEMFRHFFPERSDVFTCWDQKTNAREANIGSRIDYFVVSMAQVPLVAACAVHKHKKGSDHCPVELQLTIETVQSPPLTTSPPPLDLCTATMPCFLKHQCSIAGFCRSTQPPTPSPPASTPTPSTRSPPDLPPPMQSTTPPVTEAPTRKHNASSELTAAPALKRACTTSKPQSNSGHVATSKRKTKQQRQQGEQSLERFFKKV
eukprot:TRINITY_DN1484_c0_g1_i4.p1 TRINITY_DN1484_c0_g1~~TRINITY_DN1484_c0_g1_i4.p1  ORF type:complete len:463 (+),score=111.39 TRINITY_DN1484_c0_g1_i4:1149-2537(+)